MARCWELRDCDEEMMSRCAHPTQLKDRCPTKCAFARCTRETHEVYTGSDLLFDPTIDREKAIKEECLHCKFFLTKGPRIGESDEG